MKLSQPSDDFLKSLPFGAIGGAACGIVIFSFASLIGHSGTTGSEYVGAWDWGNIGLGIMYGGFFGLLMGPLGYIIFLRQIELRKAILPAAVGTIVGGCLGALNHIAAALFYGCIGFFLSLFAFWLISRIKGRLKTIKQT
jgi:hypothetical protein